MLHVVAQADLLRDLDSSVANCQPMLILSTAHTPPSASRLRALATASFVVVTLLAASTGAAVLHDSEGLTMDLSADGVVSCVAVPKPTDVPPACAEVMASLEQLAQGFSTSSKGASALSAALLRAPTWAATMIINSDMPQTGDHLSTESIEQYVRGAAQGVADSTKQPSHPRGTRPGRRWDAISIAGTPAVAFTVEPDAPTPASFRALSYAIYGARRMYTVVFVIDATHEAEVRAVAEHLLKSATLDALPPSEQARFAKPSRRRR